MAKVTAEDRTWEARNDLTTLVSADAIKADSKRMQAAKTESKRQQKALIKITKPVAKPVAKPVTKSATKRKKR